MVSLAILVPALATFLIPEDDLQLSQVQLGLAMPLLAELRVRSSLEVPVRRVTSCLLRSEFTTLIIVELGLGAHEWLYDTPIESIGSGARGKRLIAEVHLALGESIGEDTTGGGV